MAGAYGSLLPMLELGPVRECEVVLAFLKAEVDSARYGGCIAWGLSAYEATRAALLDNADLGDARQNAVRAQILDSYRGYERRESLFRGFPRSVEWRRVEVEPEDQELLRFIREKNWLRFTHGSRKPQDLWRRIAAGDPDVQNDPGNRIMPIRARLERGENLQELISAEGEGGTLIVLEGNSRVTAYVGLDEKRNIPMFVASSPLMPGWDFY